MAYLKKMLFDLTSVQSSNESPVHGGGVYAKYVFYSALKFKDEMICFYDEEKKLEQEFFDSCEANEIELVAISTKGDISDLMSRKDVRGLYSALPYEYYDLSFYGKRFVGTIHGLRGIECPSDKFEYVYLNSDMKKIALFLKKIIKNSNKRITESKKTLSKLLKYDNFEIITDSFHSKFSMMSVFPDLDAESISVFRCPYEFDEKYTDKIKSKGEYFLLINGNRWVKNNYRAILALDALFSERLISKKVIVLGVGDIDFSKYVVNKDKFQFEGYVDENSLNDYFFNAYAFIYPTLNEGYGYPPIKSMEYGTPVIASAITSVTEVCKDAALYFNPYSIDELKTRILTLLHQDGMYAEIVSKGFMVVDSLKKTNDKQLSDIVNHIFRKDM